MKKKYSHIIKKKIETTTKKEKMQHNEGVETDKRSAPCRVFKGESQSVFMVGAI